MQGVPTVVSGVLVAGELIISRAPVHGPNPGEWRKEHYQKRHDRWKDRQDIHQDQKNLHQNYQTLKQDRTTLKQDRANGASSTQIATDRQNIRNEEQVIQN